MEMKIRNGKRMEDYYPEFKDFKISANEGNVFDECDRLRMFIKHKLIVSFRSRRNYFVTNIFNNFFFDNRF